MSAAILPEPADLATGCPACGQLNEPRFIALHGPAFARGTYRCVCGQEWATRWANDDHPDGAAAIATARRLHLPLIPPRKAAPL